MFGNIVEGGRQLLETLLSTKIQFVLIMQNTPIDYLYHENSNLYIFRLRRILHLVKLGHSKRDCEYRRVSG